MERINEGYWSTIKQPIRNSIDPKLKNEFVNKLQNIEYILENIAVPEIQQSYFYGFRGSSHCRLGDYDSCKKKDKNGSCEYKLKEWSWPEGYIHYIIVHNVKPSDDFYKFIMSIDIEELENEIEKQIKKRKRKLKLKLKRELAKRKNVRTSKRKILKKIKKSKIKKSKRNKKVF